MTRHRFVVLGCVVLVWSALAPEAAAQQQGDRERESGVDLLVYASQRAGQGLPDDPFSGPVVTNAPFTADAINTTTQVLGDGTRIERSTTTRYYRDREGRVRSEQTILGLGALDPAGGETRTIITVDPDPGDGFVYTLDPVARTARRVGRGNVISWVARPADVTSAAALRLSSTDLRVVTLRASPEAGTPQPPESLGTRQMEGVTVTGRRTKSVIPLGQIGNDRPIEISTERWESPDLRLLVRSLQRDPRTGDVEYRLTNIVRGDPPADLFTIPADYEVIGPTPGVRTGGAGQRSGGGGGARRGGQ
jgi:hypothetical protein